jgi:hypothetical protein
MPLPIKAKDTGKRERKEKAKDVQKAKDQEKANDKETGKGEKKHSAKGNVSCCLYLENLSTTTLFYSCHV